MLGSKQDDKQLYDLLAAAKGAEMPFEASPTGRWVRFEGAGNAVYVVRDAWGEGCTVLRTGSGGGPRSEHFLQPHQAVAFARRLLTDGYMGSTFRASSDGRVAAPARGRPHEGSRGRSGARLPLSQSELP